MTGFPYERDTICPAWCELPPDHVFSDRDGSLHVRTVAKLRLSEIEGVRSWSAKPVSVEVQSFIDWEQREYPPCVKITLADTGATDGEQDLTADEARALAAALQEAADLIDRHGAPNP